MLRYIVAHGRTSLPNQRGQDVDLARRSPRKWSLARASRGRKRPGIAVVDGARGRWCREFGTRPPKRPFSY